MTEIEEAIHQLYLRRMRSTYRIYHCDNLTQFSKSHNVGEKEEDDSSAEVENELQEYCKKLYESRDQKIIPPLDTARNGMGLKFIAGFIKEQ